MTRDAGAASRLGRLNVLGCQQGSGQLLHHQALRQTNPLGDSAGIEAVLSPHFDILEAGPPAASPERRRGLEWLVTARRRSS